MNCVLRRDVSFFLLAVLVTGGPCPETSAGDNKLLHTDTLTLMWRVSALS